MGSRDGGEAGKKTTQGRTTVPINSTRVTAVNIRRKEQAQARRASGFAAMGPGDRCCPTDCARTLSLTSRKAVLCKAAGMQESVASD